MSEQVSIQRAILAVARDLIDVPERWCQGMTWSHGPAGARYCMMGALSTATQQLTPALGVFEFLDLVKCVRDTVREQLGLDTAVSSTVSVAAFNDAPTTTHEDVMLVFKHAIAKLEG